MLKNSNNNTPANEWALITGASAGLGSEFCRQLAALGYNIVLVARRANKMDALASQLREAFGIRTRVISLDLSRPDASADLVKTLAIEQIHIEFLVNNAGYGIPDHFEGPDWQQHQAFIQVMITAVCDLTWRLLPAMQSRNCGYIINVASLAALVPGAPGHTLYAASKAFLTRFTESLALENSDNGVKISALCPGFTYTEFHDVSGTRSLVSKMSPKMWMNADEVVSYGLESVIRQAPRIIAVPGRINRLIAQLFRLLPSGVALRLIKRRAGAYRQGKQALNEQKPTE